MAMAAVLLFLMFIIAGIAEIALRFIVPYNIGYYTALKGEGRYEYPYGTVIFNSHGWPDAEFDLSSEKPRIGYFGDSVVYGVGAGYGHRFPDLLQHKYPQYEHWANGLSGNGLQDSYMVEQAKKFRLDTVIYVMNMNDLIPVVQAGATIKDGGHFFFKVRNAVSGALDGLRGKSYLYTYIRTLFKNVMTRAGYGHTGFKAAELFPKAHKDIIADNAQRINAADAALSALGITFCVIILPYEMQVSQDAAKTYKALGITWEEGFLKGSTQEMIKEQLSVAHIYDAREAFKEFGRAPVGTLFVYNRGDKIDFNHPTRAGHALIAKGFAESGSCPPFQN